MRKIILLLVVFCSMSFGQGWNTTVQTSIYEPNVEKMDLATNSSGIHVLIKRTNGNIVYYNLNTSGIVDTNKTALLETNGDFPNILGSGETVYALYKSGNFIKGKYFTNGDTDWLSLPDRTITANLCNGVDAVYEDGLSGGVHLVWATRDDHPNFKTYYSRLNINLNPIQWVEFQNVTNHTSGFYGGNPKIDFSSNRLFVSFNTNSYHIPAYGDVIIRERINGSWMIPQTVISGLNMDFSVDEKILVREDTLFLFYAQFLFVEEGFTNHLAYTKRFLNGTNWSLPITITENINLWGNAFNITKTYDFKLHSICATERFEEEEGLGYRYYNSNQWSNPNIIAEEIKNEINRGFSSISNDIFVTWSYFRDDYIMYRHYDAAPLAPKNYALSVHQSGSNKYPKLTWSLNNEPDVRGNSSDAYTIERRTRDSGIGVWSAWSNIANLGGTVSSYIDYTINTAGGGDKEAEYRLTAIDLGNNSSPTQSIVIEFGLGWADKISIPFTVNEFTLAQNYPNPFNPSTKISYSIKEDGFVTLKVYDILGVEIATLVNEQKTAGSYEPEFNAANLPSGMYIYKLHAGSFTDVKKMLLTK